MNLIIFDDFKNSIQNSEIRRQLRNGGPVIRLNLLQLAEITARHKIDAATLAPPAPGTPDAVQIRVHITRHVKIDDRAHLLNVNAARRDVG